MCDIWAIKDSDGKILEHTVRQTRSRSIQALLAIWEHGPMTRWQNWYTRGFRAVKVIVMDKEQFELAYLYDI